VPIILQKFEITVKDGDGNYTSQEIDGSLLKNDYGVEFFVHRSPKGFRVSEVSTGLAVTPEMKTKKEAVTELHNVVESRGVDMVKERIKQRLLDIKGEMVVEI
jgi:hypothetical protein